MLSRRHHILGSLHHPSMTPMDGKSPQISGWEAVVGSNLIQPLASWATCRTFPSVVVRKQSKWNVNLMLDCLVCRCVFIQHKIAITVFGDLTTQQPNYLVNIIRFHAASSQIRSCKRNLLHDDRTDLAFTDRAFSHATPAVWNSLPLDTVSDLSCLVTFKRLVKTELYNRAYLCWFVTTTHLQFFTLWMI